MRSTITSNNFRRYIEGASIDETGQYYFLSGCGTFGLQNYYSKDFGVTFTQTTSNLNYGSFSCFTYKTKKVFYISSNSNSIISSIILSDAILTETTTSLPFIPSFVSSCNSNVVILSKNTANCVYSTDSGFTFTNVTLPTKVLYIKQTIHGVWFNTENTIYMTNDNGLTLRTYVQTSLIKSFTVSQDNMILYILLAKVMFQVSQSTFTNSIGPTGYTEPIGSTGSIGSTGPAGSIDSTGSIGPTGPAGSIDSTESIGSTGPASSIGSTGSIGSIDSTGSIGSTGPAGSIVPTGSVY